MTDDEILQHLWDSGLAAAKVGDNFVVSDNNCFINSFFTFIDSIQVVLYILCAFMLAGWAWTMIRGGKNEIMKNLAYLCLMFFILSMINPIASAIYGSDITQIQCRQVAISTDDARRAVEAGVNQPRLPDGLAATVSGTEFVMNDIDGEVIGAGDMILMPQNSSYVGGAGNRLQPQVIGNNKCGRGCSNGGVGASCCRRVVKIEQSGLGGLDVARNVIERYNMKIRGREWGGGDGHLGSNRTTDGKWYDHQGTDLMPGGVPPAVGTPVPALFSGRVIEIGKMYKSKPSILLQCIKIQNDNGSISRSCYNEPLPGLNVGQRVNAGDIIGKSQDVKPRYGQSTPQHIHYELSYNGKTIDTESLYQ